MRKEFVQIKISSWFGHVNALISSVISSFLQEIFYKTFHGSHALSLVHVFKHGAVLSD